VHRTSETRWMVLLRTYSNTRSRSKSSNKQAVRDPIMRLDVCVQTYNFSALSHLSLTVTMLLPDELAVFALIKSNTQSIRTIHKRLSILLAKRTMYPRPILRNLSSKLRQHPKHPHNISPPE
jgi:hypothetical protein